MENAEAGTDTYPEADDYRHYDYAEKVEATLPTSAPGAYDATGPTRCC